MRIEDIRFYFMLRRMAENPWEIVRFRKKRKKEKLLEVKMRDGCNLFIRGGYNDFQIFHRIYMRDEYHVSEIPPGRWKCVVDVGANVGMFSARVSGMTHRVIAYEPFPENFAWLERNVATISNVTPVCKAVAGKEGVVCLYRPVKDEMSGRHSCFQEIDGLMSGKCDNVPAITLDQLFAEHTIDHCDLLKIDVEGQEYDILYATSDPTFERIHRIHGEYHNVAEHDPRTRIANFVSFLKSKGYYVSVEPHRRKENHGMFFAVKRF
ncbi:MAG: FkbM family methyltransferase [Deltaproteobacteria bacterium]|nr:FkbM family methyltransferase [Deltaproteobacteria bacterium]